MEFTYLNNAFSLTMNESTLSRAVRVKNAVKDKIKRIYETKSAVVEENSFTPEIPVKESLIDLSSEKLLSLNDSLNGLQSQKNVASYSNRAVLFTQALVSKIFRVTDKWFSGMPRVEKEKTISNDIPSVNMINHLGGEVIPGSWNNVNEKDSSVSLETKLDPVPTITPEIPMTNVEIPTSLGNTDVYRFNFNMEDPLPTVAPIIENKEETNTSFDFVPEPRQIDEIEKSDFVSEPSVVPSFENNGYGFNITNNDSVVESPKHEMEIKINELLNKEFKENPANHFVPEHVDNRPAEVKIDDLLGRTSLNKQPVSEVSVQTNIEIPTIDQGVEEKTGITQAQVLARLRRVNNEMSEKDLTIKNLTSKNESLKEEVAISKEKVSEYEAKVSELTARNAELASQNERLSAKVEEAEASNKSMVAKHEAKVSELTQAKTDELESLRRQVEELKASHASEIANMRAKHAAELKSVNDSKEKQIQAIYSTITAALGETSMEDGYSMNMTA